MNHQKLVSVFIILMYACFKIKSCIKLEFNLIFRQYRANSWSKDFGNFNRYGKILIDVICKNES